MDQENYLQRLRDIRQRYGCSNDRTLQTKIPNRQCHPSIPSNLVHQHISNMMTSPLKRKPLQEEVSRPGYHQQRSRSFAQQPSHKIIENVSTEPFAKRTHNFNSFIQDLDKRISQKQKALNLRFKNTEAYLNCQNVEEFPSAKQQLNKYSSSRDVRLQVPLSQTICNYAPRNTYQKSFVHERPEKQQQLMTQPKRRQDSQNYEKYLDKMSLIQQSPLDKRCNLNISYKQVTPTRLKTNLGRSPLTQKQQMTATDSWSFNKLESIQQRIRSVLKQ